MYAEEEEYMRSVQVSKANGAFEMVEKNSLPEPNEGQVRIKVQPCGICHGDSITKQGLFPGIQYPRVPGHEIVVKDSIRLVASCCRSCMPNIQMEHCCVSALCPCQ
jgi:Alcohol dehydrogenase GroES-like domain